MPRRGPSGKQLTGSAKQKLKLAALAEKLERPRAWAKRQCADFARVTRGKTGTALAVAIAEHAGRWAGKDPWIPPEQAREQEIRAAQALAKASEPLKQLAQLGEELRAALATIQSLEAKLRAARAAQGSSSSAPSAELQ